MIHYKLCINLHCILTQYASRIFINSIVIFFSYFLINGNTYMSLEKAYELPRALVMRFILNFYAYLPDIIKNKYSKIQSCYVHRIRLFLS